MPTKKKKKSHRSLCICEKNVYVCVQKHMCRNIHSSIFYYSYKVEKKPKCSSVVEQINKFWCIHTMDYSDIKDKKKESRHRKEYTLWFRAYKTSKQVWNFQTIEKSNYDIRSQDTS